MDQVEACRICSCTPSDPCEGGCRRSEADPGLCDTCALLIADVAGPLAFRIRRDAILKRKGSRYQSRSLLIMDSKIDKAVREAVLTLVTPIPDEMKRRILETVTRE